MKVLVDELPRRLYVDVDCLFSQKLKEQCSTENYDNYYVCKCTFSKTDCILQQYGECPYLKKEYENAET